MTPEQLEDPILKILEKFLIPGFQKLNKAELLNAALTGPQAVIESLNLISFLVETESYLIETSNFKKQIVSEDLLSNEILPLASIHNFLKYIEFLARQE